MTKERIIRRAANETPSGRRTATVAHHTYFIIIALKRFSLYTDGLHVLQNGLFSGQ